MDSIKDFIANILSGNNDQARENFNELVGERAMDKLAERKQEIAVNLFQTEEVNKIDEEVNQVNEGPIGAALGAIGGTMVGGPVGGAIGAALGHKAGNVTSSVAKRTGQAVGSAARATGRAVKKVGAVGAGALAGGALGGPVGAALGGYAGHRMTRKEEFEQIDEVSKNTLASYIKKASHDVATKSALTRAFKVKSEKEKEKENYVQARKDDEKSDKLFKKSWKRRQGIAKAADRLADNSVKVEEVELDEKAVSTAQQKFMGMVYAAKKGMKPASPEVAKAAEGMTKKQARDFAKTKHEDLPSHVGDKG